ncbi:nuclear transport factor 2 family protein [Microvirga puerhi]|uniref:Nuclear transport factor 2 family protein n=1 Tax=Microvirga puerhi TaxID=2876078 RepID=A0ABS7VPV9_9HYPH|nr:nuclear transport factor 2 family protein [Microvirga puerhi]MBZ6077555.1 nuclear transport factor 2 family protein [Microvirga puerhi]
MPTQDQNVAQLRKAYAQWSEGKGADCACWMDVLADDASLGSLANGAPEMAFTAPRKSRDEIQGYLEGLTRDWEMLTYDMNDYIADDDRVVVIGRVKWRHRTTGKIADTPKVDVRRFRDGKAIDFVEFFDTAACFAAATT